MRRLVILCVLAAISAPGSLARAADSPADKQTLLQQGIDAKAKRDFDAAIDSFGHAIAADPKWGTAYTYRGSALAAKAESSEDPAVAADLLDKAIADYDAAIRLGEANAQTYTLRGIALSDKEDFKRAVADLDQALKLDAEFELAKRMRAYAADQLEAQDRAIALDGDLLRFQPRNVDLLLSRALLLLRQGRRDEARQDVDKVLVIDPKNATALAARDDLARTATKAPPGTKP